MRVAFLTALCLLVAYAASAQDIDPAGFGDVQSVDSKDISSTGLTIYPDNLGFVRETRTIDVPAGVVDLRFFGVSDMIIPQSAVLESFEGLRLEGNFDSDLISPAKLINRSVGEVMTIRRVNPVTGAATLVRAELVSAAPDASGHTTAILSTADGVEGYQCSGLAEALVLSNLPDDLHSVPVLSTRVVSETAGPKEITLTYMTRGLGWAADYRMDVEEGSDEVGLLGWLTLTNKTSKRFDEADLSVVAGKLNQVRGRPQNNTGRQWDRVASCVLHKIVARQRRGGGQFASGPASSFEFAPSPPAYGADEIIVTARKRAEVREATQEDLGDYKLYRAPQAVTVEPYQTKQIAFLSKYDVALEQADKYRWNFSYSKLSRDKKIPINGTRIYELDNSKDGTLAVPLPAGTVRTMSQTEAGLNIFIGEDTISNMPIGRPVDIEVGESFLVTAEFVQIKSSGDKAEVQVYVNNATNREVTAEFDFNLFNDVKILGRNRNSFDKDGRIYTITVPAEDSLSISFKAE